MTTVWLKTSIPGIIILGAIGSILAIYLLRLVKWFTNRYLLPVFIIYITQHARPYAYGRALTRRLYRRKEVSKLFFHLTLGIAGAALGGLLLIMAMSLTIYSFCHSYPTTSWWNFIFVAVTFVLGHSCLMDICWFAGVWQVLGREDHDFIRGLVKDGHNVWTVLKILDDLDAEEAKKKEEANKALLATGVAPDQLNNAKTPNPPVLPI